MQIHDKQLAHNYRRIADKLATDPRLCIDDAGLIDLLAMLRAPGGASAAALHEALAAAKSKVEQLALLRQGLTAGRKQDLEMILDEGTVPLSPSARNLLLALVGRAPLKEGGPLRVTAMSKQGLAGHAPGGASIEAINLSTAPALGLHTGDALVATHADAAGAFSGALDSRGGRVREGDLVRLRARDTNGKLCDAVTVRVHGLEPRDERNAVAAVYRLEALHDPAHRRVVLSNCDGQAQISEPGAKLHFANERTGEKLIVTLNAHGQLPEGPVTLRGTAGDVFRVAVSDGVNNRNFAKACGKLAVGRLDAATGCKDFPDPKLAREDSSKVGVAKFRRLHYDGPVFKKGLSPADVNQGYLGDCFCAAGIAALAQACPEALQHCIEQLPDKTYVVTFKERDAGTGKVTEVRQHIDGDLYVGRNKAPIYGSSSPGAKDTAAMEMWWPLIEKAYASWLGSYDALGQGGDAADVFTAITGRKATWVSVDAAHADHAWKELVAAVDDHRPIAASTLDEKDEAMYKGTGLYTDHAYSVLGYRVTPSGERLVTLRNPWGWSEPKGDGVDDGVFDLPLADFCRYYGTLSLVR